MSLRTYLPGLRLVVRAVCKYIADNQEKIEEFIGEEHVAKVNAVNAACQILVATLDIVIPKPT